MLVHLVSIVNDWNETRNPAYLTCQFLTNMYIYIYIITHQCKGIRPLALQKPTMECMYVNVKS